jgi:hypothetical protein
MVYLVYIHIGSPLACPTFLRMVALVYFVYIYIGSLFVNRVPLVKRNILV